MQARGYLRLYYLILIISVVLLSSVSAATTGTVVLKDGTRFENVKYSTSSYHRALTVTDTASGEKTNYRYSDIEAIFDEDGTNIAPQLLGKFYVPSETKDTDVDTTRDETASNIEEVISKNDSTLAATQDVGEDEKQTQVHSIDISRGETWKSKDSEIHVKARQKLWNVLIEAEINQGFASGDYYEGIEGGIGFGGDMIIPVHRDFAIRLEVSLSGIKIPDDFEFLYSIDPDIRIISQKASYDAWRFLCSFQWNIIGQDGELQKTIPFIYSGLGALYERYSSKATFFDAGVNEYYTLDADNSKTRFMMTLGGGVMQRVSTRLAISGTATMDIIWVEALFRESDGDVREGLAPNAMILDLKLGLVLFL